MSEFFGRYRVFISQAVTLSLPIIASQLGLVLMGFFDTIQMGGAGPEPMGAVGLASGLFFTITILGIGVTYSISPLVAIADGAGKRHNSYGILLSGLKVSMVLALVFIGIVALAICFFDILEQTPDVTAMCRTYLHISIYSIPPMLVFSVFKQYFDGLGRTLPAMSVMLIAVLMNIFLNWLLIYGHWGFSAMGVAGTAWATLISRIFMAMAMFGIWYRDRESRSFKQQYDDRAGDIAGAWQIFRMGVPIGLQYFFEVAAFHAAQIMCGWISPQHLAAHQVALSLAAVTYMAVTGLSAAGSILVGNAYGAKNRTAIRRSGYAVLLLTLIAEALFAIVFILFNKQLPLMFGLSDSPFVMNIAANLLILAAFFQISDGFQTVGAGILRGIKDVRKPSAIAFISYWIIMVPCCYILGFYTPMGIYGIWTAIIIGLTIAAILLIWRFNRLTTRIRFDDTPAT